MHPSFHFDHYTLHRQVIAFTCKFHVCNSCGKLVLFSHQKMFKIKEDIRVFSNESKEQELLSIQARKIMDFSEAYEVIDTQSPQRVGSLRRKGFRSFLRNEWEAFDTNHRKRWIIREDQAITMLRRFNSVRWFPQNYEFLIGNHRVANLRQRYSLVNYTFDLEFTIDPDHQMDRRLGIAAAILLGSIDSNKD